MIMYTLYQPETKGMVSNGAFDTFEEAFEELGGVEDYLKASNEKFHNVSVSKCSGSLHYTVQFPNQEPLNLSVIIVKFEDDKEE